MKTKKMIGIGLLVFGLAIIPNLVFADPTPPPVTPDSGGGGVPIDGGIGWLVAAGVSYGAKKLYDAKKNKPQL